MKGAGTFLIALALFGLSARAAGENDGRLLDALGRALGNDVEYRRALTESMASEESGRSFRAACLHALAELNSREGKWAAQKDFYVALLDRELPPEVLEICVSHLALSLEHETGDAAHAKKALQGLADKAEGEVKEALVACIASREEAPQPQGPPGETRGGTVDPEVADALGCALRNAAAYRQALVSLIRSPEIEVTFRTAYLDALGTLNSRENAWGQQEDFYLSLLTKKDLPEEVIDICVECLAVCLMSRTGNLTLAKQALVDLANGAEGEVKKRMLAESRAMAGLLADAHGPRASRECVSLSRPLPPGAKEPSDVRPLPYKKRNRFTNWLKEARVGGPVRTSLSTKGRSDNAVCLQTPASKTDLAKPLPVARSTPASTDPRTQSGPLRAPVPPEKQKPETIRLDTAVPQTGTAHPLPDTRRAPDMPRSVTVESTGRQSGARGPTQERAKLAPLVQGANVTKPLRGDRKAPGSVSDSVSGGLTHRQTKPLQEGKEAVQLETPDTRVQVPAPLAARGPGPAPDTVDLSIPARTGEIGEKATQLESTTGKRGTAPPLQAARPPFVPQGGDVQVRRPPPVNGERQDTLQINPIMGEGTAAFLPGDLKFFSRVELAIASRPLDRGSIRKRSKRETVRLQRSAIRTGATAPLQRRQHAPAATGDVDVGGLKVPAASSAQVPDRVRELRPPTEGVKTSEPVTIAQRHSERRGEESVTDSAALTPAPRRTGKDPMQLEPSTGEAVVSKPLPASPRRAAPDATVSRPLPDRQRATGGREKGAMQLESAAPETAVTGPLQSGGRFRVPPDKTDALSLVERQFTSKGDEDGAVRLQAQVGQGGGATPVTLDREPPRWVDDAIARSLIEQAVSHEKDRKWTAARSAYAKVLTQPTGDEARLTALDGLLRTFVKEAPDANVAEGVSRFQEWSRRELAGQDILAAAEFCVCQFYYHEQSYPEALTALEEFKKRHGEGPRLRRANLLQGLAYLRMAATEEALATFTELVREGEEDELAAQARFLIGWVYLSNQDYTKAKSALLLLIEKHPDSDYAKKAQELVDRLSR